jgi:hypothetical protein
MRDMQVINHRRRRLRRRHFARGRYCAVAVPAMLSLGGWTSGSSAGGQPTGGTGLAASLRSELSHYLATRRQAEHVSALSLRVSFRGNRPTINLTVGTARYGGGPVSCEHLKFSLAHHAPHAQDQPMVEQPRVVGDIASATRVSHTPARSSSRCPAALPRGRRMRDRGNHGRPVGGSGNARARPRSSLTHLTGRQYPRATAMCGGSCPSTSSQRKRE